MSRWVRRIAATIAISGAGLFSIPARAEMDTNEFLKSYDAATPAQQEIMKNALEWVENGIGWANAAERTRKYPPLYCLPRNKLLTGQELVDLLRREVAKAPALGVVSFGAVIVGTFERVFPC